MALATGRLLANAQVQCSLGPGVGFNFAVHASSLSEESLSNFGALFTSQFDIQFSRALAVLVWVDFFSDMSAKETTDNISYKSAINYFSVAPTLKYCVLRSPFYLFGGPGFGIKTVGKFTRSYHGNSAEEEIPNMVARIDVRIGAGYEFYLSNKLTLTPFAAFNSGMTHVTENNDWKIHALQCGIILRINTSK